MTNSFKIGLSSWIIQDGNYPDFKREGNKLIGFARANGIINP